jgi:hypothetical protein
MDSEPGGSIALPWHREEFPWFLNIHWQTLLGLCFVGGGLAEWLGWIKPRGAFVGDLWLLLQAAWLRKVRPDSTALYWCVGGLFLNLVSCVDKLNHVQSYSGELVEAIGLIATFAGIFAVRLYMLRYFYDADRLELHMNRWLTFFFSVLYFQYKFNEIAKFRRDQAASVTPEISAM